MFLGLKHYWILMAVGWITIDVAAWDLPVFNYLCLQAGCVALYVSAAWQVAESI